MSPLGHARLALGLLALSSLSLAPAAQAEAIVGRVIGSVAGAVLANAIIKGHDRKVSSNCRLYDRDGMEVYLPCDPKRPVGELVTAEAKAEVVAAPAPVAVAVAPLTAPTAPPVQAPIQAHAVAQLDAGAAAYAAANGLPMDARPGECFARVEVQWTRRPCDGVTYDAPPPRPAPALVRYAAPVAVSREVDCGCEHEYRNEAVYAPRAVASFLSAEGGYTQTTYGPGRVVAVYDSYEESSSSSVSYSESSSYGHGGYGGGYVSGGAYGYGGGFTGGVGASGGFYPYGGVGYGAGGYAGGDVDRARVAGRDPNGFLTWPGKRVR
jgi:uncharacterized membrane protein YgcG